jgi:hypothetical protein
MSHNEEILVPMWYLFCVSYLQPTNVGGVIRTREFPFLRSRCPQSPQSSTLKRKIRANSEVEEGFT